MGRVKELWMESCYQVGQSYHFGHITREAAYEHLVAMGVDPHDAVNMLDAAAPDSTREALPDAALPS